MFEDNWIFVITDRHGIAGSMFLTAAAYIYLAGFVDEKARGLIGSLMLVTGLYGTVFCASMPS